MPKSAPKTVLLVPFSSEDPSRINIWQHTHSWLKQTLDYPLYIGEHFPDEPGTYNLSLARNQAAQLAGDDWEVAVIHDADTIISPQQIKAGVAAALETGAVTYPYTERWELDFEGTKMLLQDETSDWQSHLQQYARNQPLGGCIIVRRDLWEIVRGFDTGFVGWGHEDGAFAIACEVLSGKKLQRVPGKSLHLEHALAPAKHPNNPIYLANKARIKQYMQAAGRPKAAETVRVLRDESIKTDTKSGIVWPKSASTSSMDQAVAKMLLIDVTTVLDKYKCTHWLSDGTLLGAIRENNFIAHDYDVDLGVWAPDFDIRAVHELLAKFSCGIFRLQGTPDDGMVITVGRAGVHLDMFFYYPNSKPSGELGKPSIYSCLYKLFKPYNTSNKAKRFDCEFPDFKPLVRCTFLDHQFWVPKNAEAHLVAAYGPKWRTPKAQWDTFKDQHNLKLRDVIDDMAADRETIKEYLRIRAT
jgi:hypothetical protein